MAGQGIGSAQEAFVAVLIADQLRTLLNVDRDTAARIIDVLQVKNAG